MDTTRRIIVSAGYKEDPGRPRLLYHYTNGDGLFGIVNSRKLRATKIQYLNDISELKHAVSVGTGITYKLEKESGITNVLSPFGQFMKKLRDEFKLVYGINIFVFSFSRARDLLSQWRGYCYDGGYALGFDPRLIEQLAKAQGFRFAKCIYNPTEQEAVVRGILEKALLSFEGALKIDSKPDKISALIEELSRKTLIELISVSPQFKDRTFSEEEEYRLISEFAMAGSLSVQCRNKANLIIPYCEFNLETTNIECQIDEVVVGPGLPVDLAMNSVTELFRVKKVKYGSIEHTTIPYKKWG